MRSSGLSRAAWQKSRRSNDGGNGDCIEVVALPGRIALRDSKDPAGPVLAFSRSQWHAFLRGVRTGEFD
ncbi:MAG TPA: DUF397 domain-containing protein [Pseudonocardiaceae bacterium]|jgi:hypothetical protein